MFQLRVGDDASRAQPLFGPLVNPELGLDRLDVASVAFDPGGRCLRARTTDTTVPEGKLFVAGMSSWQKARPAWRRVADASDKVNAVALEGHTLYLQSCAGAPRGRLLTLDRRQAPAAGAALARAEVVVPEPARGA